MSDTTAADPVQNGTAPAPRNTWTIRWFGHEWHSTETTTQQMCAVAETLGVWDWSAARPDVGPRQLAAWIAVLWSSTDPERDFDEALSIVLRQPVAVLVNALTAGD